MQTSLAAISKVPIPSIEHRFPFTACEILTADVSTIQSAFFGKNPNSTNKSQNNQEFNESWEDYQEEGESGHKKSPGSDDKPTEETSPEKEDKKESPEKKEESPEKKEEGEVKKTETTEEVKTETTTEGTKTEEEKPEIKVTESENKPKEEEAKEIPEIANYFFSFLGNKELNVTLVGYFCRFLNHMLMKKPSEVIKSSFDLINRCWIIFGAPDRL
jgi:flagellar biosynthesis GTPase FlhF